MPSITTYGAVKAMPSRTHRIDRHEGDIPGSGLDRLEDLAGGIESDVVDRKVEPARKLARKLRGHAARRAAGRVPLRENGVAEVDGDPQLAAGGELGCDIAWIFIRHDTWMSGQQKGERRRVRSG